MDHHRIERIQTGDPIHDVSVGHVDVHGGDAVDEENGLVALFDVNQKILERDFIFQ